MLKNKIEIEEAKIKDVLEIVFLMECYYKEDGYNFNKCRTIKNLEEFIGDPNLGKIFVAKVEESILGYVILTSGYSFEHGGKDAFIDELFVSREFRGKGIGKDLLDRAINFCRLSKFASLHLEVEKTKSKTYQMYLKSGFFTEERILMTLAFPESNS
jgi:ribosomal protein S18 acetylase RimI-like enzyme